MFRWYEKAEVCYAYLSDVSSASEDPRKNDSQFSQSKWFKRGWTLQELLAPNYVDFFDQTWTWIGSKGNLDAVIRKITGIADLVAYKKASVAQKMSWASYRETTRIEDMSYCLLGLFGVHMPPLYGEGENAFMRLQLEIMKTTDDESLLAWKENDGGYQHGLLATSPRMFADSSSVVRKVWDAERTPHTMSSKGLCVHFKLVPRHDGKEGFLAPLNCAFEGDLSTGDRFSQVIALHLSRNVWEYHWRRSDELEITDIDPRGWSETDRTMLYVPQLLEEDYEFIYDIEKCVAINFSLDSLFGTGLKLGKYLAGKCGAVWTRDVGAGVDSCSLVVSISTDAILPVWAAITLDEFARHSGPRDEIYTEPENYSQKVAIVVGVSNGRPWIDIMVLDKNQDIEQILEASLSAKMASDRHGAVDFEGTVSARTLATGLDRVSRKFLGSSLNGRLMTGGGSSLSELIVEVTYDLGGKLRWPVRAPLF
jgi:hypothetical protein